jgi:hypothetical protein
MKGLKIRRWRRTRSLGFLAGACVGAIVVLVVVLYLLPSLAAPTTVTIERFNWTIVQGTWTFNNQTEPWFVEQYINQSAADGYPFQVSPHGTFNVSLVLVEYDPKSVPICTISVAPPLEVLSTFPTLPAAMQGGEDNLIQINILVTASAGTVVDGAGIVNATGCANPGF